MFKILKVLLLIILIDFIPLIILAKGVYVSKNLSLEISYPYKNDIIFNTPVLITGSLSDPSAKVTINGTSEVVAENGFFQGSADLIEGENNIVIVAKKKNEQIIKNITIDYIPENK